MHRREVLGAGRSNVGHGPFQQGLGAGTELAGPDASRSILPYAPGGATDAIGRPWADKLTQAFGQQFVIENRGGASGMIGAEAAAKSAPDGYTLPAHAQCPALRAAEPAQDALRSRSRASSRSGRVGDVINGFVIHPSVGVKTFKEMVEYAKKNPGKLTYGSSGNGTANHLRLEMLKYKLGIDILHVPYRGGADTLNDVLPGTVHMMNEPVSLPHVKAGKLILLAINGPVRHPDFPDVPTLTELGVTGADVPIWFSIFAPAGTPKDIIAKLNAKMLEIAKTDDMKAKLIAPSTPSSRCRRPRRWPSTWPRTSRPTRS